MQAESEQSLKFIQFNLQSSKRHLVKEVESSKALLKSQLKNIQFLNPVNLN